MKGIVGIFNLFYGVGNTVMGLIYIFFVLPRMQKTYDVLGTSKSGLAYDSTLPYALTTFLVLLGIINLAVAWGIFTKKSEKFYRIGKILLITTFIATGAAATLIMKSVVAPLYQITADL